MFWYIFDGEPTAVDGHSTGRRAARLGLTINEAKLAEFQVTE